MWISHPRHASWRWWWMTVVVTTLQVITPIYSQGCNTSELYGVLMVICVGPVTDYWWPGQDISEITLQLPGRIKTIQVNSSHHQQWHKVTVTADGVMKDKTATRSGKTYYLTIPTLSVAEVIDCTDKTKTDLRVTSNQKMFWATNCTNVRSEWWIYLVIVLALALLFGLLIFIVIKCMRLQKSRVGDSPQVRYSHVHKSGPRGTQQLPLNLETVSSHNDGTENLYSDPNEIISYANDGRRGSSHDSENSIYGLSVTWAETKEDHMN
ncbi:uncharacterized protein [Procambarus clarkii]|uniref:uncharacterized protein isoform X2 n=1 Tax=Procambarus clarkii TaxID=6728 RepID=UPI0037445E28